MVCCRDPNFKSEQDYDDYDDYGNVDYMDFDQVMMYNMKPSMTMTDQLNIKSRLFQYIYKLFIPGNLKPAKN